MTSTTQEAPVTSGKQSPNGTRYCRTCGFSDCPSLTSGNCPRWPASRPNSMFDMLTLDDLYELHSRLCAQAAEIHAKLMDGQVALISPLSDEWALQSARVREVTETADAAYAEIARRERENIDA
jgi:hypothetical protein